MRLNSERVCPDRVRRFFVSTSSNYLDKCCVLCAETLCGRSCCALPWFRGFGAAALLRPVPWNGEAGPIQRPHAWSNPKGSNRDMYGLACPSAWDAVHLGTVAPGPHTDGCGPRCCLFARAGNRSADQGNPADLRRPKDPFQLKHYVCVVPLLAAGEGPD